MMSNKSLTEESLVYRLQKRAEIRRQIPGRKSVQENKPDRIADLLEEAAAEILYLKKIVEAPWKCDVCGNYVSNECAETEQIMNFVDFFCGIVFIAFIMFIGFVWAMTMEE